jgi:hypothetical protein
VVFFSCGKEKVVAPVAEFDIQILDKIKSEYVNLERPYQLKVNVEYRLLSQNSSEYNSFYMGDSIKSGKIYIKHIYSSKPKSDHRGTGLEYDTNLNKGFLLITYTKVGTYPAAFVAVSVGNDANDIAISVNDKNPITVIP